MSDESGPLDIVAVLREEIGGLPGEARPYCLAQLERRAGARYREWADASADAVLAAGLRVCAAREEGIAEMIETAFPAPPEAASKLEETLARIADRLADRFSGAGTIESFASQAVAERAGSETWKQFAKLAAPPEQRWTLDICSKLETESAEFLDAAIARTKTRG